MNSAIKPQLKALLERHEGRDKAITRRELKQALNYQNDRKLRLIISELRHEHFPILFATDKPAGYYLPANLQELEQGKAQMRSYIIDECWILRDLKVYGARYVAGEAQGKLL